MVGHATSHVLHLACYALDTCGARSCDEHMFGFMTMLGIGKHSLTFLLAQKVKFVKVIKTVRD